MLVTKLCWGLYDGDRFKMLVTESFYWRLFRYEFNRSPTSQTCHQHIASPTSVTNIDVTKILACHIFLSFRIQKSTFHPIFEKMEYSQVSI